MTDTIVEVTVPVERYRLGVITQGRGVVRSTEVDSVPSLSSVILKGGDIEVVCFDLMKIVGFGTLKFLFCFFFCESCFHDRLFLRNSFMLGSF